MASPQLENGYARVANEILDALSRAHWLKGRHWRVLTALMRHTYGNRGSPLTWRTSANRVAAATGLSRRVAPGAIRELEAMNLLTVKELSTGLILQFQKDHTLWQPLQSGSHRVIQSAGSHRVIQDRITQGDPAVDHTGGSGFRITQGDPQKREDSLKESSKEREGATRLEGSLPLSSGKETETGKIRNGKLSTGPRMDAHVTAWRLWTIKQFVRSHGKAQAR